MKKKNGKCLLNIIYFKKDFVIQKILAIFA